MGGGEIDVSAAGFQTRSAYWRSFALPGVLWLFLFVVVPAYALLAIAFGRVDYLFQPVPYWNPLHWNPGYVSEAFSGALPGGEYWPAIRNTLVYVTVALSLCFIIGYPVAYYVARHAKRSKTLLIVLLVIPFWVSYLLRMLAWIGLLSPDGYVNEILSWVGITHPPDWLNGNAYSVVLALVYGYIPYFILPVFAGLDRIDRSQIEAARDLGATPFQAFRKVTLPLSRPSILAGSALVVLPMFGDYYTNDLISASPHTNMIGNEINLFVQGGSQKNLGAALVLVLMLIMAVGMGVLPGTDRPRHATTGGRMSVATTPPKAPPQPIAPEPVQRRRSLIPAPLRNPWGQPRFLVAVTWTYVAWALVPVVIAILFSFNAGRSRSVWQGFSIKWWWGDPNQSVFHYAPYTQALLHSLLLAGLDMLIATPLGVLLALGLARWRGRGSGVANSLMLIPLVTPELVMAVSLLVVFTQLTLVPFTLIHLGTPAQVIGQVTFSLSYVVVIIRSRLASIGPEYEEAARDLGATSAAAIRLVLLPLLFPAILSSMLIVFALSIDDFVVTQYMSSNSTTTTIPMFLYSNARGGTSTPALNALATILVFTTLIGITIAYLAYTALGRRTGAPKGGGSAFRELSGIEAA